jgi:hypothetical protein
MISRARACVRMRGDLWRAAWRSSPASNPGMGRARRHTRRMIAPIPWVGSGLASILSAVLACINFPPLQASQMPRTAETGR